MIRNIQTGDLISKPEFLSFGIFLGFAASLLGVIILLLVDNRLSLENERFSQDFPIFRGIALFIIYIWTIAWNIYGWTQWNVNYKLILGFNYHSSSFANVINI